VADIDVSVTRDVCDNLALHFQGAAGKPPVGVTSIRFDFNEISRGERDGLGVVTGDFQFAAFGQTKRQGSLTLYYRPGGNGWLRTGLFDLAEDVDVASHVFALTVRDSSTDVSLTGALAEARMVQLGRVTSSTLTDVLGRIQLEVLPGDFDIEIHQGNYEPVVIRNVPTLDAVQQLGDIRMVRLTGKVSIFLSCPLTQPLRTWNTVRGNDPEGLSPSGSSTMSRRTRQAPNACDGPAQSFVAFSPAC